MANKLKTMRKVLCFVLCMCLSSISFAQIEEKTDTALLNTAVAFFDSGDYDQALEILQGLNKRHPNDYNIMYETALCYYQTQKFSKALSLFKKLKKSYPTSLVYAMYGNCLDDAGKTKQALEIYDEGIKTFPNVGRLHLEKGMIYYRAKDYDNAYSCFGAGVDAEPRFSSNYFRLSQLLCGSNRASFGMICGEVFSLLSPGSERAEHVSAWICEAYRSNVKLQGDSVKALLSNNFIFNSLSPNAMAEMSQMLSEMFFLTSYSLAAKDCYEPLKDKGKMSLADLVDFRKRILDNKVSKSNKKGDDVLNETVDVDSLSEDECEFVDTESSSTDETKHKSMRSCLYDCLLKYQKEVFDAGHWEAYNMWLFRMGDIDEFNKWNDEDPAKFREFADWFNSHPFSLETE